VGWKPGKVAGQRCLALAYIDARDVMNRLDQVFGLFGWYDNYVINPGGATVTCFLSVRGENDWITKSDVGGESEQPDEGDRLKAAFSDALKRAGVKFGIGRYLYSLDSFWCDFDPVKKQILKPPQLPPWALPQPKIAQPDQAVRDAVLTKLTPAIEAGMGPLQKAFYALTREEKLAVQGEAWEALKRAAAEMETRRSQHHAAAAG
jgi:hypothetical protein